MKLQVDSKMLPMKAHYFFYNAGTAPIVPFMPTLARQLGFSSFVVGTIYTILPILGMLIKPLFGAIADKFQQRKALFIACQVLTAVAFMGIKFIQPIEHTAAIEFHCNDGVADLRYCPANGQLDNCTAAVVTDESATEEFVQCKMTCQISEPWQSEEICNVWQANQTASCVANRSAFDLSLRFKLNHIEKLKECLLVAVHDAEMVTNDVVSSVRCPRRTNSTLYFQTACVTRCSDANVMQAFGGSNSQPDSTVLALPQFWMFFTFMVLSWMGMAAVVSLGDAICFQMLGDNHGLFGNQRMWGAVGWGLFSLLAGLLVDEMSRGLGGGYKEYSGVFYLMILMIAIDLFASAKIEHKQSVRSSSLFHDIGVLFTSPSICIFFVWCIAIGLGTALVWNFLFWHLEVLADEEVGCNSSNWMKTLQGLAMGIQCFGGELPFFFVSGAILKRIGHIHAMSLVLLGFGIRFLLYSVLTNPWWVLPIELMQGVTFGVFYSTMASYASLVAPPGTEATLQGIVGAIFEGIGVSAGSFIGGLMIEEMGGSYTFRWFGIVALALFALHVVVQKLMEKCACTSANGGRLQYSTPVDALTMLNDDDHYPDRT